MGIITWAIFGLIVGAIAKYLMPGPDPGGIFVTMLIGIVGSIVGGMIASSLGLGGDGTIWSTIVAVGGAMLLLFGYRKLKN